MKYLIFVASCFAGLPPIHATPVLAPDGVQIGDSTEIYPFETGTSGREGIQFYNGTGSLEFYSLLKETNTRDGTGGILLEGNPVRIHLGAQGETGTAWSDGNFEIWSVGEAYAFPNTNVPIMKLDSLANTGAFNGLNLTVAKVGTTGGNLTVAGSLTVGGKDVVTQASISGGTGVYVGSSVAFVTAADGSMSFGKTTISNSTAASYTGSVNSGALTVAGGIGVGMDSYFNGVRIGKGPGSGVGNTVLGEDALSTNASSYNTAVGYQALKLASSPANANTATGYKALSALTTGSGMTAVGFQAGISTTTGTNSVAVGYSALNHMTSGYNNVAVGLQAGAGTTTGFDNVMVGYQAGTNVGTGANHQSSIYIGAHTKPNTTTSRNNTIVIGTGAISEGDSTTVIGNGYTISTHLRGQTISDSLKVNGAVNLNNQVLMETGTGTPTRAMRIKADGTVLVKAGGDISMGIYGDNAELP